MSSGINRGSEQTVILRRAGGRQQRVSVDRYFSEVLEINPNGTISLDIGADSRRPFCCARPWRANKLTPQEISVTEFFFEYGLFAG